MSEERRPLRVRHGRLHFFVRETLKRVRLAPELASQTADAMVAANLTGEDEDGVCWLPELVTGLSTRHVNGTPDLRLRASSGGTAVLDGDNGPGPAVGHRAMTEAIGAANRHGIGATSARRSNRLGIPGHFAAMALSHQMAGIAITNAPGRREIAGGGTARDPQALGIAIPTAETAAPLVLNLTLPADGAEETEAERGLALALESLVLLSGCALPAEFAAPPHPEPTHQGAGHLFLAFRVRAFAPWAGFRNRMVERLGHLRRARIVYPGQRAAAVEEERRTLGIPLDEDTEKAVARVAYQLGMNEIWDTIGTGSARRAPLPAAETPDA